MIGQPPASEDLNEMIVHVLADQRDRSDIITAVCERTGMDWSHAADLVGELERDRAHAIAARQTPLLVFLSACTSAGGILLVVYCVQELLQAIAGRPWLQVLLILAEAFPFWLLILGLAMISGGVLGMYRTMLRYFET